MIIVFYQEQYWLERCEAEIERIDELEILLDESPETVCVQSFGSDPSLITYSALKNYDTLWAVFPALRNYTIED